MQFCNRSHCVYFAKVSLLIDIDLKMSIGKNGEKKASGKKPHMKNTYNRTKIFMKSSAKYIQYISAKLYVS